MDSGSGSIEVEVVFPDESSEPGDVPLIATFADLKETLVKLYADRLSAQPDRYDLLILPQDPDEKVGAYKLKNGDRIVIIERRRPQAFRPRRPQTQ